VIADVQPDVRLWQNIPFAQFTFNEPHIDQSSTMTHMYGGSWNGHHSGAPLVANVNAGVATQNQLRNVLEHVQKLYGEMSRMKADHANELKAMDDRITELSAQTSIQHEPLVQREASTGPIRTEKAADERTVAPRKTPVEVCLRCYRWTGGQAKLTKTTETRTRDVAESGRCDGHQER
jgi:hypothetical protein